MIWLGTTRNLSGTHYCLNIDTLREITGDIFRPTTLTPAAIQRLTLLAGAPLSVLEQTFEAEPLLEDSSPSYALDPTRGVETSPITEVPTTEVPLDIIVELNSLYHSTAL